MAKKFQFQDGSIVTLRNINLVDKFEHNKIRIYFTNGSSHTIKYEFNESVQEVEEKRNRDFEEYLKC